MNTVIEGKDEAVRAVLMAALIKEDLKAGKKVFTNLSNLTFKGWVKWDFQALLRKSSTSDAFPGLLNCSVFLNDAYSLWDSRQSSTKANKVFSYLNSLSRARAIDWYFGVPFIDILDKRVRRSTNLRLHLGKPYAEGSKCKITIANLNGSPENKIISVRTLNLSKYSGLINDFDLLYVSPEEEVPTSLKRVLDIR